ncbi:MAG: FAD-dependent oxidoreductase [Myxococcota bacterium]
MDNMRGLSAGDLPAHGLRFNKDRVQSPAGLMTTSHTCDIVVVGAGIFGITAAIELAGRGHEVCVIDPGPLPHPLAASTDISKVVRMEYGSSRDYMAMGEAARAGWLEWNDEFASELYHETGVLMMSQTAMEPGGFERDSFDLLRRRGHQPERLDGAEITRRFPAWRPGAFGDGFYHRLGGYAESGRTVVALVDKARRVGVGLYPGHTAERLLGDDGQVTGVSTRERAIFSADTVVVAAGAWTPLLLPELHSLMRISGHPIVHLELADPSRFSAPDFPVFTADIARTGWYGFPVHPAAGVVKIANHGVGVPVHPSRDERVVSAADIAALRAFLSDALPALADAPIAYTRRCLYCDTADGHFVIARHPHRDGLCVASGGSGHGFKFAPVLGSLIADAAEGQSNPDLTRFRWRTIEAVSGPVSDERDAARYQG